MRDMMKWFISLLVLIFALHSNAESQSFDFEDEKGINHILVILDAPLEFISGKGDGVSGFISYDPTRPQDVTGSIHLTVDSIELNNSPMTKNMYGKKWLNAKEHPEISFVFSSFIPSSSTDSLVVGKATGVFTFLGVTKEIKVDLSFNYLKDAANKRAGKKQPGDMRDLLVLRSDFNVLLDEYGLVLTPGTLLKVSNEVQAKVNIVGYTAE